MARRQITDRTTGRPRVLSAKCRTCIFLPNNKMDLRPGRLKEMVEGSIENGSWITCHSTLEYGPYPDAEPAICRGFYDAHGENSWGIRLAEAVGGCVEVAPPDQKE